MAKVLNDAKISTEVVDNISTIKWAKLVQFCAFAGLSALTRLRLHQLLRDPKLTALFIRFVREGAKVMQAAGIKLDNYEGLIPLKKVVEEPDLILIREYTKRADELAKRPIPVTISMLQDVLRSRPLEVEETLAYLVRSPRT
jgi:ketopantoate reductase